MQTSSTAWDTRTPAQLVLNSRALFYRAASLPPSPSGVRPRGSETSSPRASFESTHSYSTSEMRRGSEPTIERGRDIVRAGIAERIQVEQGQGRVTPRASPSHIPTSTKAQRLLGLTHQLKKDSRFSGSFDSDEDEDEDDARSFVDFGSSERDGDYNNSSSASNRLSLATTCSFNFAPVSPSRAPRRDTPPSPTAYFTSFSVSSSSIMPPAATTNAAGTTRSLDAASAPLLARKGKASFSSQLPPPTQALPLPPTTNMLSTANRADLLRRHKKLQQVLGDGVAMVHPFANADARLREDAVAAGNAWPHAQRDTIYLSASRRHSITPISPTTPKRHSFDTASLASVNSYRSDASSFVDMDDDNDLNDGSKSPRGTPDDGPADSPPTPRALRPRQMDSVASFADSLSSGSTGSSSTRRNRHRGRSFSVDVVPSSPGSPHSWVFLGTGAVGKGSPLADDEQRKRKRNQLAKLHRFLGSGVPAELALGITSPDEDLPPVAPETTAEDGPGFKGWIRRRNRPGSPRPSGSYSPPAELEDGPLNAAELNDRERMINVKRAQKMEKVFGAQPPQTLFHTRPFGNAGTVRATPSGVAIASDRTYPNSAPTTPQFQSVSLPGAGRGTLWRRPSENNESESSQNLLAALQLYDAGTEDDGGLTPLGAHHPDLATAASPEFRHYQKSLASLGAIVERGDRESLMNLYDLVNERSSDEEHATDTTTAERRRSLPPVRDSASSAASVLNLNDLEAESAELPTGFGVRRKRAQKLVNFFGVQHHELFGNVLQSLENGVRDEANRGSLRPDEVQELMTRLRVLKSRGAHLDNGFSR